MKKESVSNEVNPANSLSFFQKYKWAFIPMLFAIALYFNTLHHGFVLDDKIIFQDKNINSGIKGALTLFTEKTLPEAQNIKPYRPVTGLSFALDYAFFKDSDEQKMASTLHLMNVLYYALALFFTFVLMFKLFKNNLVALAVSLLFAAHPIHTEVVANIKSRDEILAYLFGIIALITYLKFKESSLKKWLFVSLGFYFLATLSKENAILFIVLLPFVSYFSSSEKAFNWSFLKELKLFLIPALLYLFLQRLILGMNLMPKMTELDNMLVGIPNVSENLATRIYIVGLYLYKLLMPHPLFYDYSINYISKKSFSSPEVWMSLAAIIGLIVVIFKGIFKKNKIAFGLLFLFAMFALTCNLFIAIGATFAERLAFTPSLGFVIALVFILLEVQKKISSKPIVFLFLISPIIAAYSFKTITRNSDWKDNDTLFSHDYLQSNKSLRIQNNYATNFYIKAKASTDSIEKRKLFLKSVEILDGVTNQYGNYVEAYLQKGISYLEIQDCASALANFEKAKKIAKYNFVIEANLGIGYINCGKSDKALTIFRTLLQKDKSLEDFYLMRLGVAHINTSSLDSAAYYFNRVKEEFPANTEVDSYIKILADLKNKTQSVNQSQPANANPVVVSNADAVFNEGYNAYQKGNKIKAKKILEDLVKTSPNHAMSFGVLGLMAADEKNHSKAIEYYKKSIALNPTDFRMYNNLGNSYFLSGKEREGVKQFEQCIKLAPNYDKPYIALQYYYKSKNDMEKSNYYAQKLQGIQR